jgi:hypothetical protein
MLFLYVDRCCESSRIRQLGSVDGGDLRLPTGAPRLECRIDLVIPSTKELHHFLEHVRY